MSFRIGSTNDRGSTVPTHAEGNSGVKEKYVCGEMRVTLYADAGND